MPLRAAVALPGGRADGWAVDLDLGWEVDLDLDLGREVDLCLGLGLGCGVAW